MALELIVSFEGSGLEDIGVRVDPKMTLAELKRTLQSESGGTLLPAFMALYRAHDDAKLANMLTTVDGADLRGGGIVVRGTLVGNNTASETQGRSITAHRTFRRHPRRKPTIGSRELSRTARAQC
jgi:hypothetical protein